MKRLTSWLLILTLCFSLAACAVCAEEDEPETSPVPAEVLAEEEEGDDSAPEPVDMMEDEDLEIEDIVIPAQLLQFGDEGDDVLALQTRLQELQYYTGNLSGKYREGTQKAVTAFQADFELDQTGVADVRTMALMFSVKNRPLRYSYKGEDVKELQTQLTQLGYYTGKIDGNYLDSTRKAVEELQKKNGLEADGVADPELQDMIAAGQILSRADGPDVTSTPAPNLSIFRVDGSEDGVPVSDTPVPFTKKLSSKSTNKKLIKQLQTRLQELGYYENEISGNFQKYTTRAVKKFQLQNGLEQTGVVDETTWNLIFNDSHIVLPNATPKPTPEPTPVPFHIVVDVANQITSVYGRDENGEYTVPVRQMLCSTGMKATPSDVGDWVLNGRHATWCIFPKWGNSYARYWTRINGSIAFHSPIYTAVSNSAMKIGSYNKLGQRASHGCIRLAVWDAKWIYDNIGKGTVVSIVEGMEADQELKSALKLPPLDKKYCTPISTPVPTPEPEYSIANKPDIGRRTLKTGSQGPEVYWLQRALKDLGYYDTKCTGSFKNRTAKAVKNFQRDHAIYQNGKVDQKLIDAIAEAGMGGTQDQPETTPEVEETPAP